MGQGRKKNRGSSDFDLAFFFDKKQSASWSQFLFEIEDSPLILFKVDWVDAENAQPELKTKIEFEKFKSKI